MSRKLKGGGYADQVDPAAHLRINYEKYDLKLRNKVGTDLSFLGYLAMLNSVMY